MLNEPSRTLGLAGTLGLCVALGSAALAAETEGPTAAFDRAIAAAEGSLRQGELAAAQGHYREALVEGWRLLGALERLDGNLPAARDAYLEAVPFASGDRDTLQSLAYVLVRTGAPARAVEILSGLVEAGPADARTLRLLAMALSADGRGEEAVRRLDEASEVVGDDPQEVFLLATEYLWLKRADAAERLFARVVEARPIPQTHVLIGRAYRDAGEYERARRELQAALAADPGVPRAHYYLGMVALSEGATDPAHTKAAEEEFRKELERDPRDPLSNGQLGVVLLDTGRAREALPFLETAAREEPRFGHLVDLGRGQIALDDLAAGVASTRRALDLAREEGASEADLERIHFQLGRALRMLGQKDEAASHLEEAGRLRARRRDASEEAPSPSSSEDLFPLGESSPVADLTAEQRSALREHLTARLAGAYFNLGVVEAQGSGGSPGAEGFARAADLFAKAARLDPEFPAVQSSLGVAAFNAGRFDEAARALERAVAADPGNAGLKRMLALSSINTQAWEAAARLLQDDPELGSNPSLQSAYALALVRCRRGAEAEKVLDGLLAERGDSAELRVLLGQAQAQQEEYAPAIESLTRALQLDPRVAEAHRTLGVVYLRQGRLDEAEKALRAELEAVPSDTRAQLHLAAVLDAQGRPSEAIAQLRGVLEVQPDSAEALYLLGRMLLAQGSAEQAVAPLEAAARLTPEDAGVHYQLGQAYEKLGRSELARKELEASRRLEGQH